MVSQLMIGGFTGFQNPQGSDWGEQLLNKVASNTIRHLFTKSESVEVKVRCQPASKLLQGGIDSFQMSGRGLVIRKAFRTEELTFETDAVSIDFGSVMQGKLALKQPTQAIAKVKLNEEDINVAFEAELVRRRLENLSEPALTTLSDGKSVSFADVRVELFPGNRIALQATADLGDRGSVPVSLSCVLGVERRRRVTFQDIEFDAEKTAVEQREVAAKLAEVLGDILNNMVDLDRFDLDGITMRINRLETQGKALIFAGYAKIERVPQV